MDSIWQVIIGIFPMWECTMEQIDGPTPTSPDPHPDPHGGPSLGSKLKRLINYLLVSVIIVGLSGAVVYLMSDRNHRQYRLNTVGTNLQVERGLFLPRGYEKFTPPGEPLRSIYAPIPIPPDIKLGPPETFEDRTDLDRALFGLLSGWTTTLLSSESSGDFQLAIAYIERCELFPGLSETQHIELKRLRADTNFRKGEHTLKLIRVQLKGALKQFQTALELGTTQKAAAQARITHLQNRIASLKPPSAPLPDLTALEEKQTHRAPPVPTKAPSKEPNPAPPGPPASPPSPENAPQE